MTPVVTSLIVLMCIFGSAMLGLFIRSRFPEGHLSPDTKEVVKLVVGIVGTMTGMVLGLLVASAKSSFDSQRGGVERLAANVIVLDKCLAHFGEESKGAREVLKVSVEDMIQRIWPSEAGAGRGEPGVGHGGRYDDVYDRILNLTPKNDAQKTTQAQALKVVHDTAEMRWLLYAQRSSSIPTVFLVLMVAWLAITFASYGLFAPNHATTLAVLLLGSAVVSSAVFLILELDRPFGGIMHISSAPLKNAVMLLGK